MPPSRSRPSPSRAARPPERPRDGFDVTAVVVAHDGGQWLGDALAALQRQTRRPDRIVGVDTGSADNSAGQLGAALGSDAVRTLDRDAPLATAVAAALAAADG